MTELSVDSIENQMVQCLPELGRPADRYWRIEGDEGYDSGCYAFFESLFCVYVRILLWMPETHERDRLLQRSLDFVELMMRSCDPEVVLLAFNGLFEAREQWFYTRVRPYCGERTCETLDERWPGWRDEAPVRYNLFQRVIEVVSRVNDRVPELWDQWGVRAVIAQCMGLGLNAIPGRSDLDAVAYTSD